MLRVCSALGFVLVLVAASAPPNAASAQARVADGVARLEITRHEPLAGGMPFGSAGAYEKLVGIAHLEVDPTDPHNSLIQDLDEVPRNARGMVEYSTDIYILKPVDTDRGNGKIFFQVLNRGTKGIMATFADGSSSSDPSTRRVSP